MKQIKSKHTRTPSFSFECFKDWLLVEDFDLSTGAYVIALPKQPDEDERILLDISTREAFRQSIAELADMANAAARAISAHIDWVLVVGPRRKFRPDPSLGDQTDMSNSSSIVASPRRITSIFDRNKIPSERRRRWMTDDFILGLRRQQSSLAAAFMYPELQPTAWTRADYAAEEIERQDADILQSLR